MTPAAEIIRRCDIGLAKLYAERDMPNTNRYQIGRRILFLAGVKQRALKSLDDAARAPKSRHNSGQ